MSEIRKNDHRLMQVLLAPVISEKATLVADKNEQVVFEVAPDATKQEVKAAVELLFKVEVNSVNVLVTKGKAKRFGRFMGKRPNRQQPIQLHRAERLPHDRQAERA